MELFDKIKNMKVADFKPDFGKLIDDASTAITGFEAQSKSLLQGGKAAVLPEGTKQYRTLDKALKDAEAALGKVGNQVNGKFVKAEGVAQEAFEPAFKAFNEAKTNLSSFLGGNEINNVKAPEALSKAYGAAEDAAKKVTGKVEGFLGMGTTQGWRKALDKNLNGMKVWDSKVTEGRKAQAFGRVAGVAAGAGLMADAVMRSQSNGEDRSGVIRLVEFLAGGGVAAGSLLAGKAI